ncbi:hypothetical protein F4781DRAFT_27102 [Annulohypoxylon bovei var. microspora]|nr:hypothetical protein F4781DRAFT_27102 [Annulohypoxylon bovei var. microspora]
MSSCDVKIRNCHENFVSSFFIPSHLTYQHRYRSDPISIVMLSRAAYILLTLLISCSAGVKFTTGRWEIEQGVALVLSWADATGMVNIDLAKVTTEGPTQPKEIAKGLSVPMQNPYRHRRAHKNPRLRRQ